MLSLESKRACIFGLPGEGKSNLLCHIADRYKAKAFVYDTMHEYPTDKSFDVYRPRERYSVPELEKILRLLKQRRFYKLLAIDEANRFCPSKPSPLPEVVADLNDTGRHPEWGNITPIYIARRPTQLNQDLTELAHYLFIFNLKGKNDIDYLNDFAKGLGDEVFNLPSFHFIIVDQHRTWTVHKPVPLMPLNGSHAHQEE